MLSIKLHALNSRQSMKPQQQPMPSWRTAECSCKHLLHSSNQAGLQHCLVCMCPACFCTYQLHHHQPSLHLMHAFSWFSPHTIPSIHFFLLKQPAPILSKVIIPFDDLPAPPTPCGATVCTHHLVTPFCLGDRHVAAGAGLAVF